MWIALSICGINESNFIIMTILAFIGFRLFDIWKPSIIGRIDEKVEGGWGVMGDDIVAGIARPRRDTDDIRIVDLLFQKVFMHA